MEMDQSQSKMINQDNDINLEIYKNCSICGKEILNEAIFCKYCLKFVEEEPKKPPKIHIEKKYIKINLLIFFTLMFIQSLYLFYYYFLR